MTAPLSNRTSGDEWPLPDRLLYLIRSGFWPATAQAAMRQNLQCLVSVELVRKFAPPEEKIVFNAPPFHTVSHRIRSGEEFWHEPVAVPDDLSFDHAVLIGDFGIGSDAPLLLDYSLDPEDPAVLRLLWDCDKGNQWILAAASFDQMCELLQLPC